MTRRALMSIGLTIVVTSAACSSATTTGPTTTAQPKAGMSEPLSIKLLASPTTIAMSDLAKFSIGLEVTNRGSNNIDPALTSCKLIVNGKPSMAWTMAIGNGSRESTWFDLPPGKMVTMSWPLGDDLFDAPGTYHLVMTLGDQQASADITVTR